MPALQRMSVIDATNDRLQTAVTRDAARALLASLSPWLLRGVADLNYVDDTGTPAEVIAALLADRFGPDWPAGKVDLRKRSITYTADMVTPDGSDTGVYGDGCEPGHGATHTSGWWDPTWSRYAVDDDPAYSLVDRWTVADGDPAAWLAETIATRIGRPDSVDLLGDPSLRVYAADSDTDFRTGIDIRPAAHARGFTTAEAERAASLLCPGRAPGVNGLHINMVRAGD